jgi:hypothetical protein
MIWISLKAPSKIAKPSGSAPENGEQRHIVYVRPSYFQENSSPKSWSFSCSNATRR